MNAGKNEHGQNNDREIDELVDHVIAQYAKVEPRPGLEGRVLARLAGARVEKSRTRRWWGVLAFSTATVLALALFWLERWEPQGTSVDPVAKVAVPVRSGENWGGTAESSAENTPQHGDNRHIGSARATSRREKVASARQAQTVSRTIPKLKQFPSPVPLTDQERLLALYVQKFPERAALVARAQTELYEQAEFEMAAPWPTKVASDLERHE